jgi:hypothetical protein
MNNKFIICNDYKFILSNKRSILDNKEICKLAVQKDGLLIRFVKKQTFEICKIAIKENWKAVKFINFITPL